MATKTFEFETETKVVRYIKSNHKIEVDSAYITEFAQHVWTARKTTQNYASTEFYTELPSIGEVSMAYFALDLNPRVLTLNLPHPPKVYLKDKIKIRGIQPRISPSTLLKYEEGAIVSPEHGPLVDVPVMKNCYSDRDISEYLWPYYLEAMKEYDKMWHKEHPHSQLVHFLSTLDIREAIWTNGF